MTCKDCIHCEACERMISDTSKTFKVLLSEILKMNCDIKYDSTNILSGAEICQYFQDRSRFVELPCKVGITVYTVSLKHGVVPWGVYAICSTVTEWDAAPKITLLARSKKIDKSAKFSANAVSTSVFFTREEAEQALKERIENDA